MKDTLNHDRPLTTEEAAEVLNVKPRTMIELRQKGEGPYFVKIGRLVRYRYRDLIKYLDQNTKDPSVA